MRRAIALIILVLGVAAGTNVYAAEQLIVLDPINSIEVRTDERVQFTVGASFLLPHDPMNRFISVEGLPSGFTFLSSPRATDRRVSVTIVKTAISAVGTYQVKIQALDKFYNVSSIATMQISVISSGIPNQALSFDSLEQVKAVRLNQYYSFPVAVSDADMEELQLIVTGGDGNALGYVSFKETSRSGGRVGGVISLYLYRTGQMKINLFARDRGGRDGVGMLNTATADLVIQGIP